MTKRTMITLAGLLIAVVIALCGCTTYDNFKEAFINDPDDTTDAISIGVYEPMSGSDKDAAKPEIDGIELAHELAPEVVGKKVELVYADNKSEMDAAETAIKTLLDKKPIVVLGSYGSLYSLIASKETEKNSVPAITMTNTNPLVTRNNKYYFRICYIDATQGRLLANYLDSIKVKKAGVMLPKDDEAAMAMATAFTNTFDELTEREDSADYYEEYSPGQKKFTDQLESLQKEGVKYVLLPGEVTDALNIMKQAAEMNLDVTFLGDMTWGQDDFYKQLSPKVDPSNIAFVQFFATDGDDEPAEISESRQKFLDAYQKKYDTDQEPEYAVALGYDAYMLALDAIEKATADSAEIASGEAIRATLMSKGYLFEGASGKIEFNKSGDPKKTAYICTWTDNGRKTLYTIEADKQ